MSYSNTSRVLRRPVAVLALLVLGCWQTAPRASEAPLIAAASDLRFALTELSDLFTRNTGQTVRITYGSSGDFRRQIAQGAPFEVFLSADEDYVYALAREGLTLDPGVLYGVGRIAIFTPRGSPITPDEALKDLKSAVADGRLKKLAIANPEHAPYGRAAREALTMAGLWDAVGSHLVLGENATQAAQFAASGAAQAGLVPYSLVLAPALAAKGRFALVPEEWHTPLRQRMVLLRNASNTARRFYTFMQSPSARELLTHYGFAVPEQVR